MHPSNLSALSSSSNRKNFKANSTQLHNNNVYHNNIGKNASLNDININYNISSHVPQPTSNFQQYSINQQPQPSQPNNASAVSSSTSSSSPRHTLISNSMANNLKQPHPVSYSALPHGILINNNTNSSSNNSNMNSHHGYNHLQHQHQHHHTLHQPHHHLLSANSGSAPSIDLISSMMPSKGEFCLIYAY
jgi:hypothetical protein